MGRGWGKKNEKGYRYFSQVQVLLLIEYLIIWYKIQVIINPLLAQCLFDVNTNKIFLKILKSKEGEVISGLLVK